MIYREPSFEEIADHYVMSKFANTLMLRKAMIEEIVALHRRIANIRKQTLQDAASVCQTVAKEHQSNHAQMIAEEISTNILTLDQEFAMCPSVIPSEWLATLPEDPPPSTCGGAPIYTKGYLNEE